MTAGRAEQGPNVESNVERPLLDFALSQLCTEASKPKRAETSRYPTADSPPAQACPPINTPRYFYGATTLGGAQHVPPCGEVVLPIVLSLLPPRCFACAAADSGGQESWARSAWRLHCSQEFYLVIPLYQENGESWLKTMKLCVWSDSKNGNKYRFQDQNPTGRLDVFIPHFDTKSVFSVVAKTKIYQNQHLRMIAQRFQCLVSNFSRRSASWEIRALCMRLAWKPRGKDQVEIDPHRPRGFSEIDSHSSLCSPSSSLPPPSSRLVSLFQYIYTHCCQLKQSQRPTLTPAGQPQPSAASKPW